MAQRLSEFARYFIADTSRRQELEVPVLLWETPNAAVGKGQTLDLAQTSPGGGINLGGEPVVLPLRKGTSATNAFVMGVTVGRTENNDLVLYDPSVSRFHAYFMRDSRTNTWKLVDAESKNGTWAGALKLEPNGSAVLQDKTRVRFGDVEMTFLTPETFFRTWT
ncbi:MAG TPA: FHA domain-containing protein [Myxococcaceae bacterium]|nr:FHA domain-containing protein [Myxococcaceae bacterium]